MSAKRSANKAEEFSLANVEAFQADGPTEDIVAYYKKYQVVLIKGAVSSADGCMTQIRNLFQGAPSMIDDTFSVESKAGMLGHCEHSSADVFGATVSPRGQWYSSFIAQASAGTSSDPKQGLDDINNAVSVFRDSLPLTKLPFLQPTHKATYTKPVWVFVGHNDSKDESAMLHGRPEHIDSVDHDGTWHLQSNGTKWWYIRPAETPEWGDQPLKLTSNQAAKKQRTSTDVTAKTGTEFADGLARLKVVVEQGDILVINTRVWWHQTRIPYTGAEGYSISYAIDFYCKELRLPGIRTDVKNTKRVATEEESSESESEPDEAVQGYSNVDGLYASRPLKSGEVVFYEEELPDCALPRSEEPNCEIVWLEDGRGALFALQDLQVGDWLTVAPSDSEISDEGSERSGDGSEEEGSEEGREEEECCDEDERGSGEEEECSDGSEQEDGSDDDDA